MRKNETGDLFLLNPRVKTMAKKKKKKAKRSAAKRSNPAPKKRRAKRRASPRAASPKRTKRTKRRSNPKTSRRRSARRRNPSFGGGKTFVATALGGGLVRAAYYGMGKIPQLTGYWYFGAQAAAPVAIAFGASKLKAPNVAAGAAGAFGFVIGDLVNGAYQLYLSKKAVAEKAPAPGPTGLGSVRRFAPSMAGMGSTRNYASGFAGK
jgi:hypothetical protein